MFLFERANLQDFLRNLWEETVGLQWWHVCLHILELEKRLIILYCMQVEPETLEAV